MGESPGKRKSVQYIPKITYTAIPFTVTVVLVTSLPGPSRQVYIPTLHRLSEEISRVLVKVILSLLVVPISVTPEGRGPLPLGPKDHTKVGAGTLFGKGAESLLRVDEHVSE
jgi:hypothetical protein